MFWNYTYEARKPEILVGLTSLSVCRLLMKPLALSWARHWLRIALIISMVEEVTRLRVHHCRSPPSCVEGIH